MQLDRGRSLLRSDLTNLAVQRGVPLRVLYHPRLNIGKDFVQPCVWTEANGDKLRVSVESQLKEFRLWQEGNPSATPLIFSALKHDTRPAHAAFQLFTTFLDIRGDKLPLWHNVTGGVNDQLVYGDGIRRDNISFLVISNIAANSTAMKFEKVRDILSMVRAPCVIVAAGATPLEIAFNKLYVKPRNILYFK